MPFYVYLAATCVVVSIALIVHAVAHLRFPSFAVRRNLGTSGARITDFRELVLSKPARERLLAPVVAALARAGRRVTPRGMLERIEARLSLAGLSSRWSVERVLATKAGVAATFAAVGVLLVAGGASGAAWFLAMVAAVGGFLAPDFVLDARAKERQQLIAHDLADVIDHVTISVEAGLGFEAALARTAQDEGRPLADELARTLQDIRFGMSRHAAFEQLLTRTDVPDLRQFVAALAQADRHGVPIAQVLRVQAAELREKRRARAEERAMKLPVKLVFPLVVCILPTLFIVLVGPAAIRIADSPLFGQ